MSDLLVRNVPDDDLGAVRSAAAERGQSLQAYLVDVLHMQALFVRRQTALRDAEQRLADSEPVPENERAAMLDAIAAAQLADTARLADRPER